MLKPVVIYTDVSQIPGVETRANHGPEFLQALNSLGFKSIGYVEARVPMSIKEEKAFKDMMAESDANMILDSAKQGEVVEVLASPDGLAMASIDQFFGGPIVIFRSISEEGIIVDTRLHAQRGPLPSKTLTTSSPLPILRAISRFYVWLAGFATGHKEVTLETRAESKYFTEQVDTMSIAELWKRHQDRVRTTLIDAGENIRPHDSVAFYVASSYRVFQIIIARDNVYKWVTRLVIAPFYVLGVLPACILYLLVSVLPRQTPISILVASAVYIIALLGLYGIALTIMPHIAIGLVLRLVYPRLPGPKPVPLKSLLDEIQQVYDISV